MFTLAPFYSNGTITISWVFNERTSVICTLQTPEDLLITSCVGDLFFMSGLNGGIYTLFIQGTDNAGNVANIVTHTWEVGKFIPCCHGNRLVNGEVYSWLVIYPRKVKHAGCELISHLWQLQNYYYCLSSCISSLKNIKWTSLIVQQLKGCTLKHYNRTRNRSRGKAFVILVVHCTINVLQQRVWIPARLQWTTEHT